VSCWAIGAKNFEALASVVLVLIGVLVSVIISSLIGSFSSN